VLRQEISSAVRRRQGARSRRSDMGEEKYRLVVGRGRPTGTSFRDFWKMFYDEGAVVVVVDLRQGSAACTTSASATTPTRPLESLAEYCLGCYTNLNLPVADRHDLPYIDEYQADAC